MSTDAITTAGANAEELRAAGLLSPEEAAAVADAGRLDTTAPVRATWKGHGNPVGFTFYGRGDAPEAQGVKITKVVTDPQGITLKRGNGRAAKDGSFGVATKFWAADHVLPEAPAPTAGTRARAQAAVAADATQASSLAVYAGPLAWLDPEGLVLPMSATAYPELIPAEGVQLRCLGACGEIKSAGAFPCTANKGDGKGRYLECGACQGKRLAENKARKERGEEPLPRPRATLQAPAAE
jgi:hypothetical protein